MREERSKGKGKNERKEVESRGKEGGERWNAWEGAFRSQINLGCGIHRSN